MREVIHVPATDVPANSAPRMVTKSTSTEATASPCRALSSWIPEPMALRVP